jgi:hypothetical protein
VRVERGPLGLRSYLQEKVVTVVQEAENNAIWNRHADHVAPSVLNSWH